MLGQAFEPINRWQRFLNVDAESMWLVALLVGTRRRCGCSGYNRCSVRSAATTAGAAVLLLGSALASRSASGRRMWLYGWRRPGGTRWLLPAAFAALLAVPLRGLFPAPETFTPGGVAGRTRRHRAAGTRDRSLLPRTPVRALAPSLAPIRPGGSRPHHAIRQPSRPCSTRSSPQVSACPPSGATSNHCCPPSRGHCSSSSRPSAVA